MVIFDYVVKYGLRVQIDCMFKRNATIWSNMMCGYMVKHDVPPPWPSWQGESGVQSFDSDGAGSIPATPPTQIICFVDEFNKLA